ncbi:MAG: BlaI/MecI/CopY family transcriptional regulator [bacterium]|nr:BlaI/MecI/CopY family transcriptional regulator [bacterium]
MTTEPLKVTDAELSVLKLLWDRGPATIRELTDRLYPGGGTSHYATVQKLLERLAGKGCVERKPQGRSNVYNAAVDRQVLIRDRLRETADKLCEGSLTPLLTHLVGATNLAPEEIAMLRRLVDEQSPEDDGGGA